MKITRYIDKVKVTLKNGQTYRYFYNTIECLFQLDEFKKDGHKDCTSHKFPNGRLWKCIALFRSEDHLLNHIASLEL